MISRSASGASRTTGRSPGAVGVRSSPRMLSRTETAAVRPSIRGGADRVVEQDRQPGVAAGHAHPWLQAGPAGTQRGMAQLEGARSPATAGSAGRRLDHTRPSSSTPSTTRRPGFSPSPVGSPKTWRSLATCGRRSAGQPPGVRSRAPPPIGSVGHRRRRSPAGNRAQADRPAGQVLGMAGAVHQGDHAAPPGGRSRVPGVDRRDEARHDRSVGIGFGRLFRRAGRDADLQRSRRGAVEVRPPLRQGGYGGS